MTPLAAGVSDRSGFCPHVITQPVTAWPRKSGGAYRSFIQPGSAPVHRPSAPVPEYVVSTDGAGEPQRPAPSGRSCRPAFTAGMLEDAPVSAMMGRNHIANGARWRLRIRTQSACEMQHRDGHLHLDGSVNGAPACAHLPTWRSVRLSPCSVGEPNLAAW